MAADVSDLAIPNLTVVKIRAATTKTSEGAKRFTNLHVVRKIGASLEDLDVWCIARLIPCACIEAVVHLSAVNRRTGNPRQRFAQWSRVAQCFSYPARSIRPADKLGSVSLTLSSQPAPNGSSESLPRSSASLVFDSITSPVTGLYMSLAALTLSTTPNG